MTNDIQNPSLAAPPPVEPAAPRSIFQIWVDALTKPNRRNYAEIASLPQASAATAFVWVFLATLLEFFVSSLVGQVGGEAQRQLFQRFGLGQNLPVPEFGSRTLQLLCGAPIIAVVVTLWFAVMIGVVHLIARAFGGTGTYDRMAYVFAAIFVPTALIATVVAVLQAIPVVGFAVALCFIPLSLALSIYVIVIEVIATMAVYGIGGGSATVAVLALPIVLGVCCACALIIGLAALGPMIGNVFSSINNSLQGVP
jgi:hypothetical protein